MGAAAQAEFVQAEAQMRREYEQAQQGIALLPSAYSHHS
jgi:hypothetical protein